MNSASLMRRGMAFPAASLSRGGITGLLSALERESVVSCHKSPFAATQRALCRAALVVLRQSTGPFTRPRPPCPHRREALRRGQVLDEAAKTVPASVVLQFAERFRLGSQTLDKCAKSSSGRSGTVPMSKRAERLAGWPLPGALHRTGAACNASRYRNWPIPQSFCRAGVPPVVVQPGGVECGHEQNGTKVARADHAALRPLSRQAVPKRLSLQQFRRVLRSGRA